MTDDTEFCFLSAPGSFGASRILEVSLIRFPVDFYTIVLENVADWNIPNKYYVLLNLQIKLKN